MWPRSRRILLVVHILVVLAFLIFLHTHVNPIHIWTDHLKRIEEGPTTTLSYVQLPLTRDNGTQTERLQTVQSPNERNERNEDPAIRRGDVANADADHGTRTEKLQTVQSPNERKEQNEDPAIRGGQVTNAGVNHGTQTERLQTVQSPNERKERNQDPAIRRGHVAKGYVNHLSSPYVITWEEHVTCRNQNETKLRPQNRGKLILYWEAPDQHQERGGFTDFCQRPTSQACQLTFDSAKHAKADAVVFHSSRLRISKPPFKKRPGQIWVAFGLEPPPHWQQGYASPAWRGVFNWSMTYRVDSDIFAPVGSLVPLPNPPDKDYRKIASRKTRSVAWFVSNCSTQRKYGSKREDYVKELRKYIDVYTYGECGRLKCSKDDRRECLDLLSQKYRFYLAFENSLCQGYVTEKFFNKFLEPSDVVPVVLGGFNYKRYIPEGTYINTADFRSPRDLARHLKALGKDVDAYAAILKRKDHYVNTNCRRREPWCQLCEMLHKKHLHSNVYEDLSKWWQEGTCMNVEDLLHQ